jgi:hypothetical protein
VGEGKIPFFLTAALPDASSVSLTAPHVDDFPDRRRGAPREGTGKEGRPKEKTHSAARSARPRLRCGGMGEREMETSVGLVAGSHNRNELVVIRRRRQP